MQLNTIRTQFCMAANDDNSVVGAQGDAQALSNSNAMNARGVCSKYYANERSPIYLERFARSGEISTLQSVDIFNELKSRGYIDSKKYYVGYSDKLISAVQSNPTNFPVIKSLSPGQKIICARAD